MSTEQFGASEAEFLELLGRSIRRARVGAGLTQASLARRLGLARSSIANLERGSQGPTAYGLVRLVRVLGLHGICAMDVEDDVTAGLRSELIDRTRERDRLRQALAQISAATANVNEKEA